MNIIHSNSIYNENTLFRLLKQNILFCFVQIVKMKIFYFPCEILFFQTLFYLNRTKFNNNLTIFEIFIIRHPFLSIKHKATGFRVFFFVKRSKDPVEGQTSNTLCILCILSSDNDENVYIHVSEHVYRSHTWTSKYNLWIVQ